MFSLFDSAEITDLIVGQTATSPKDLFSLAQVSHSVSAIALDHLWKCLPTAFYIFNLFPGFSLVQERYCLTQDLHPGDWLAFDQYSYRIHEITSLFSTRVNSGFIDIDPHILQILHSYRPHRPLFPSLQAFITPKYLPMSARFAPVIMPLMIPTLRKVRIIAWHSSSTAYLERLSSIPSDSQLRHLRISGPPQLSTQHAVLKFTRLEYLDMNFHGQETLFHGHPDYAPFINQISTYANLTSLLIYIPTRMVSIPPPTHGFQQLKKLAITGSVGVFVDMIQMTPYIEYLVLEATCSDTHRNWEKLLVILQKSCALLSHLTIYGRFFVRDGPLSTIKLVDPLLKLSLKGLTLRSYIPIGVHLSDIDLAIIATAWPNLLHLELFIDGQYMLQEAPSMSGIKTLLHTCSKLVSLRMSCWNRPVDMSVRRQQVSRITLDNTYPPFVSYE